MLINSFLVSEHNTMAMSIDEIKREYEFPIKWTIHNFLSLDLTTENDLKSPIFSTDDGTEWQMQIFPDNEHYFDLYLNFIRSINCHVLVTVNIGIMNADGMCTYPQTPRLHTFNASFIPTHTCLSPLRLSSAYINRDILLENKNYLLPNGHLTVLCQVRKLLHFLFENLLNSQMLFKNI